MQENINFHGISLINQWGSLSKELEEKVISLWDRNGVLPQNVTARERVKQVVLVALDANRDAIAVCTAYAGKLPKIQPARTQQSCYFYRMFIQPQSRVPHLMRIMTTSAYDVLRTQRPNDGPDVFAIITENLKLTQPAVIKLFERNGFTPKMTLSGGKLLIIKEF